MNLKVSDIFFKTWMECFSGQVATSIVCFHFKKCSTGDSSYLENFFRFPLLIVLNCPFSFNDQHSLCDACFVWEKCCIFREIVQVRIYSSSFDQILKMICFLTSVTLTVHCWPNIQSKHLNNPLLWNEVDKLVFDMNTSCIFSIGQAIALKLADYSF